MHWKLRPKEKIFSRKSPSSLKKRGGAVLGQCVWKHNRWSSCNVWQSFWISSKVKDLQCWEVILDIKQRTCNVGQSFWISSKVKDTNPDTKHLHSPNRAQSSPWWGHCNGKCHQGKCFEYKTVSAAVPGLWWTAWEPALPHWSKRTCSTTLKQENLLYHTAAREPALPHWSKRICSTTLQQENLLYHTEAREPALPHWSKRTCSATLKQENLLYHTEAREPALPHWSKRTCSTTLKQENLLCYTEAREPALSHWSKRTCSTTLKQENLLYHKRTALSHWSKRTCSTTLKQENLLYHTEAREPALPHWSKRTCYTGKSVSLKVEMTEIFSQDSKAKSKEFSRKLLDDEWLLKLASLNDIFGHLNTLNRSLQGPSTTIIDFVDKFKGFIMKLELWEQKVG